MSTSTVTAKRTRKHLPGDEVPPPTSRDYWESQGFEIQVNDDFVLVMLANGSRIEDRGDSMTLVHDREPSDTEIRTVVAAAKARGWDGIRVSGGSESFQRRFRVEALRAGFAVGAISLECEDGKPGPIGLEQAIPEHVRHRMTSPSTPSEADSMSSPLPPGAKAPECRP